MNKKAYLFICFTSLILVFSAGIASSQAKAFKNATFFGTSNSYNIYFDSGYDYVAIIENVDILRFEDIGGKTFVVVEPSGFNLKDNEGFILFDAVTAIIPDRNFRVKKVNKDNPHFHSK